MGQLENNYIASPDNLTLLGIHLPGNGNFKLLLPPFF